jgi:prepilin-type processing-associated H-X9-DG protein
LLTVIAIIGILAAIIIPVVGRVRESAKTLRCIATLRGAGQAFAAYAADHKDHYPNPQINPNPYPTMGALWYYQLMPYVSLPYPTDWTMMKRQCAPGSPLGCPAYTGADGPGEAWISYEMAFTHSDWIKTHGNQAQERGVPGTSIPAPSQSLLASEGLNHDVFRNCSPAPVNWGLDYRHRDKVNALFADGHVGSFNETQMLERWDTWFTRGVDGADGVPCSVRPPPPPPPPRLTRLTIRHCLRKTNTLFPSSNRQCCHPP